MNQQVKVRGEVFRIVQAEDLSHLGTKYFGQRRYTLERLNDRSRWVYSGKQVGGNSILRPAK
jgi:hypothetical protein